MLLRLPDEIRVALDAASKLPGCAVLMRPWDVEDRARWNDDLAAGRGSLESAARAVKRAVIAIDGVQVQGADNKPTSFNPANAEHWRAFPVEAVAPLFNALYDRATLTEQALGNSDSPAASAGTSAGAS